jgi:hypothetical protein
MKWISVEDELPKDKKDYQIYCLDTNEQMVGFHIGNGTFQFAYSPYSGEIVCRPSHWRETYEPPTKREIE